MANSKTEPLSEKGLALEFTNPRKFVVFLTVANSETDPFPEKGSVFHVLNCNSLVVPAWQIQKLNLYLRKGLL